VIKLHIFAKQVKNFDLHFVFLKFNLYMQIFQQTVENRFLNTYKNTKPAEYLFCPANTRRFWLTQVLKLKPNTQRLSILCFHRKTHFALGPQFGHFLIASQRNYCQRSHTAQKRGCMQISRAKLRVFCRHEWTRGPRATLTQISRVHTAAAALNCVPSLWQRRRVTGACESLGTIAQLQS
jgi:hypothetical protein